MSFVQKSVEEINAMSDAEFKAYKDAELKHNEEVVDGLKAKIEALETKGADSTEEMAKLVDIVKEHGVALNKVVKRGSAEAKEVEKSLPEVLKENAQDIKAIAKGVSAKEVVVKADTLRSSITDNTESYRLPEIERLAHRKLSMYDLFPKVTISESNNNGTITYTDWDEATTVRAAAMIAEGATFPESTATFIEKSIKLQKVGDTLPVSEEFYEDEARFASELELFLNTNIDLEVDQQLYNGDNTGSNLKGITQSATAFNPTGLTQVPNATFYDLLAIAPEMNIGYGSKYMFDVVLMNKKMINKLQLTKDANNNYVIPPFTSLNGMNVAGMIVIESNVMADNECILADRRFGTVYEKSGITMAKGYVDAQFVEDLETIKVRKRLALLIKESNARAFIYISDVDTAITAISSN